MLADVVNFEHVGKHTKRWASSQAAEGLRRSSAQQDRDGSNGTSALHLERY